MINLVMNKLGVGIVFLSWVKLFFEGSNHHPTILVNTVLKYKEVTVKGKQAGHTTFQNSL